MTGKEASSAVVLQHGLGQPLEKQTNKQTGQFAPHEGSRVPSGWRQPGWSRKTSGAHSWGGNQICYTRAPSVSWHRGPAGEACGPESEKGPGSLGTKPTGLGPGRREILSSKLDRTLTSGTIASAGRGDADFPRALHVNPSHQIQPLGA